jgi:hypothetical protein
VHQISNYVCSFVCIFLFIYQYIHVLCTIHAYKCSYQDNTLDFEPQPYPTESKSQGNFKLRMLQLKVRLKGILHGLCTAGMPPDNITDFFVSLISDENFFPATYLWKCESDYLDFNMCVNMCVLSKCVYSFPAVIRVYTYTCYSLLSSRCYYDYTTLIPTYIFVLILMQSWRGTRYHNSSG